MMNIFELNRFQMAILPSLLMLKKTNFYIQAKPSFGKKISYILTALQKIDSHIRRPQVFIVAPSADLALRLFRIANAMATNTKIKTQLLINDYDIIQEKIASQLIICTSGILHQRLIETHSLDLNEIKLMIFDEYPILTASSRSNFHIRELLNMKNDCQMIFFSANFESDYEIRSIERFSSNLKCFNLLDKDECFSGLLQFYVSCIDMNEKNNSLRRIFRQSTVDKSIVFVSDKKGASLVENFLCNQGYATFLLTNQIDVNKRLNEISSFESAKQGILIITYPLSVGLELTKVSLIINYDLPKGNTNFYFEYFYRVEECTRSQKKGFVVNLVDGPSKNSILKLEDYYGFRMSKLNV